MGQYSGAGGWLSVAYRGEDGARGDSAHTRVCVQVVVSLALHCRATLSSTTSFWFHRTYRNITVKSLHVKLFYIQLDWSQVLRTEAKSVSKSSNRKWRRFASISYKEIFYLVGYNGLNNGTLKCKTLFVSQIIEQR